jgi:hypothetical protein
MSPLYKAIREAVEAEVAQAKHASHSGCVDLERKWERVRREIEALEAKWKQP